MLLFSACEDDFLDRSPLNEFSEEIFWNSERDAISAVNACYSLFERAENILNLDCTSDNAFNPHWWEGYTVQANGNMEPNNTGNHFFDYTTIRRCNWVLENIHKTPDIDERLKKRLKAEIRFLRAYEYFVLSQFYGAVPLVTTTLSLEQANQERIPKKVVVDFIISELEEIEEDLPEEYPDAETGRITKGAALGLKARLLLFEKYYTEAAKTAMELINLNQYELFPDYEGIFKLKNENNKEVIFDIQYIRDHYSNDIIGRIAKISSGGWASVNPLQSLVNAYECEDGLTIDNSPLYKANDPYQNRDPRFYATIVYPGDTIEGKLFNPLSDDSRDSYRGEYGTTGYVTKKYVYPLAQYNDMWNTGMNIILIRYAEILLIYAEAKIESGIIDETVYNALNKIRRRAGMPEVDRQKYNDVNSLRKLVRRERRVELAMEGLRTYDIYRWRTAEKVLQGPAFGVRPGSINEQTGEVIFSSEDHIVKEVRNFDPGKHYLWPIPQDEMDVNPAMVQNPGY